MRFLDCTPNQQAGYVDEADRFYKNPQRWLNGTFNKNKNFPSYLIFFDVLVRVSLCICSCAAQNFKLFRPVWVADE